MKNKLGTDIYESWLRKIEFVEELKNYVLLSVSTRFIRDWVTSRYLDQILQIIKVYKKDVNRIELRINERKEKDIHQISHVDTNLLNKKENKLALCSAIAATQSKEIIESRGHKIENLKTFPIVISDDIESITKTKEALKILNSLNLMQDVDRLKSRKARSGKSLLRGRGAKIGKSVLFVVSNSKRLSNACGAIPGVEARAAKDLSVLDLAPGGVPIRLVVYSKSALKEIEKIKSPHLELLVNVI